MNLDDFENKLRHQKLRQIPGAWREPILQKAGEQWSSAVKPQLVLFRAMFTFWRELFKPCRYAWLGMAATWIVLWIINADPHDRDSSSGTSVPTRAVVERVRSYAERRRDLVELTGPLDLAPAAVSPKRTQPKPHSERTLAIRHC